MLFLDFFLVVVIVGVLFVQDLRVIVFGFYFRFAF
jgi:hypothetical protein